MEAQYMHGLFLFPCMSLLYWPTLCKTRLCACWIEIRVQKKKKKKQCEHKQVTFNFHTNYDLNLKWRHRVIWSVFFLQVNKIIILASRKWKMSLSIYSIYLIKTYHQMSRATFTFFFRVLLKKMIIALVTACNLQNFFFVGLIWFHSFASFLLVLLRLFSFNCLLRFYSNFLHALFHT